MKRLRSLAVILCLYSGAAWAQALIVSQVVDGDIWQTTMVLTNTTAASTVASLSFFQETTGNATVPWNLAFLEMSSAQAQAVTLAPGETLLLHTPGTATTLSIGWGQVVSTPGVVAYAIFTKRPAGLPAQVGTSPAIAAASRILVPFDNTLNNVASMALVNASSASETITVNLRTTNGTVTQPTPLTIPAQGHIAFTFPTQFPATAGQSGLAEFYTASGTFSVLALSFNPAGSLTTAPIYNESGPPIIAGTGSAGAVTFSGFAVSKVNTTGGSFPATGTTDYIGGQFASYSSAEWNLAYSAPTFGSCSVLTLNYPVGGKDPSYPDNFLDAGANIPVSGPGLTAGAVLGKIALTQGPIYNLTPAPGTLVLGGTYTLTGTGGTQVGPFTISSTLPSSFAVTNWNTITAINRANPLTVNWAGSGFNLVIIFVQGSTSANSTTNNVAVSCAVQGSLGTYTIPAAALALLPATATGQFSVSAGTSGGGTVSAVSSTAQTFTPPLVGGGSINYGSLAPFLTATKSLTVQ
ncbi:MAG: hypothetical protein M3N93_04510 [Acidobacteriota bacterium]|nr:hypothetical protein [Acidobacteriota bacterium]